MHRGMCPSCHARLDTMILKPVELTGLAQAAWMAVACCCPECGVILGVQMEPVAIADEATGEPHYYSNVVRYQTKKRSVKSEM